MAFFTVVVWWGVMGESSIDQNVSEVVIVCLCNVSLHALLYSIQREKYEFLTLNQTVRIQRYAQAFRDSHAFHDKYFCLLVENHKGGTGLLKTISFPNFTNQSFMKQIAEFQ